MSLAQNIDKMFFAKNGKLTNEFNQLYASLFKSPEPYIDVVTALGRKKTGMTREEILEITDKQSGGALSKVLDELEYCGFIRKYNGYGKKQNKPFTNLLITIHYFTLSSSCKMRIMTNISGPHRPILPCIVLGADWLLTDSVWHMYNKSK